MYGIQVLHVIHISNSDDAACELFLSAVLAVEDTVCVYDRHKYHPGVLQVVAYNERDV